MAEIPSGTVSLKRRVIGASAWSLLAFGINYALRLGSSLIMTRLLVPKMFGVMAIAMMVMTGLAMFSDMGLRQNIVQSKRGGDPDYLNTVWVVQVIRGALLWALALVISVLVYVANKIGIVPPASVYADPELPYVIALVSISALFGGFQSTKFSEASRQLSLGRVTQIRIAAQVIGLVTMLAWVWYDRSIWALVAGAIVTSAATSLLSHAWLSGAANRWFVDRSALHEIIHFGKWMFISSILGFLINNADRMLLGGYIDSATLGIYVIAYTIYSAILQVLNKFIADVSYSALSEVHRDRVHDLKRTYYRMHTVIGSVAYFGCGILMFAGQNVIDILYDHRYSQAGWMLEVLSIALLPVPYGLVYYAFLAIGLPRLFTQMIAVEVLGAFIFIPAGFHFYGLTGAVWGIALSYSAGLPAVIYLQIKHKLFDFWKEALLLLPLAGGMILGKAISLFLAH